MRLDKYLTEMGVGSRSEVKTGIRKGFATVNGIRAQRPEMKVVETDSVCWKGEAITFVNYEYIMLHKPAGVVSATEDSKDQTVLDLIKDAKRKDLFPVGRLDKDTEGLLLLTNDGQLAHHLLSPKHHVSKIYYAKVDGVITEEDIETFKRGFVVDNALTALPSKLTLISKTDVDCEIYIEIYEGKFHQIKRMIHAVGKEVVYLKRLTMGPLQLDPSLNPGDYRYLNEKEVEDLYAE